AAGILVRRGLLHTKLSYVTCHLLDITFSGLTRSVYHWLDLGHNDTNWASFFYHTSSSGG
ncbi:MAG: hypothetical protein L0L54_08680, partial [Lactococcus sp.]|nr:hypothetical protein [Lactococcus sp.]